MRVRAVAVLLLPIFLSACIVHEPPENAAPPSAEEAQRAAEFDRGRRDGEIAGERKPVAGAFCAGGVVGVALPLLILLVAEGGGSGSNCGGGGCGGGGGGGGSGLVPMGSPSYADGYKEGYESAYAPRRDRAAVAGFLTGLAIFAVGTAIYISDENRRQRAADDFSNSSSPVGITVVRF